jgi:hypothetical protein
MSRKSLILVLFVMGLISSKVFSSESFVCSADVHNNGTGEVFHTGNVAFPSGGGRSELPGVEGYEVEVFTNGYSDGSIAHQMGVVKSSNKMYVGRTGFLNSDDLLVKVGDFSVQLRCNVDE